MKLFFILILLSSVGCYGEAISGVADSWFSINMLKNIFWGKEYQASQAYKQQNYDQSLMGFHILMNDDPYNSEYNYNIGTILYKQQKYDDAQQAFLRTIERENKTSKLAEQSLFNLGNCYYKLKLWQKAVDTYQQLLKIHTDNQQAHHNLQLALYKLKEQQQNSPQQDQKKEQDQKKNEQSSNNKDQSCDTSQSADNDKDGSEQNQSSDDGKGKQNTSSGSDQSQQKQSGQQGLDDQKNQQMEKNSHQQGKQQDGDQKNGTKNSPDLDATESSKLDQAEQSEVDAHAASKNQIQDATFDQQGSDDKIKSIDGNEQNDELGVQAENADRLRYGDDKKEMGGIYKKPELKNQLQDQYEAKASDDKRLNEYHASVMKTLENLEEKIQKHVIKNKIAMQGSGKNGKNSW